MVSSRNIYCTIPIENSESYGNLGNIYVIYFGWQLVYWGYIFDMTEFDVNLKMDWLIQHGVRSDCQRKE